MCTIAVSHFALLLKATALKVCQIDKKEQHLWMYLPSMAT